jgi:ribonucleoside-diphosphate reductase alpha chain
MLKAVKVTQHTAQEVAMQPVSTDIWDKKYRLKNKQGQPIDIEIDDTYQRVAKALSDTENTPEKRAFWNERFLWALRRGAIPAGRITSNAGALEHKPATSTINCTVSGTIEDSMNGILEKVHEAGLTLKAGCGIGYEFSSLRPKGAFVAGAGAYTSGPLSFMDIYDKMCFTVSSAGGRRGAQMATFDISHPDVMDFIKAKREAGRLRQFNLSCLITREFMEAVKADADWRLAFPIAQAEVESDGINLTLATDIVWREWPVKNKYVTRDDGRVACRVYKTLKARRLWDVIMSSTYDYAEPGFILIDRVNEMNNNWWCENIRATNPCVTADTWVMTTEGARRVSDLTGLPFTALVDGAPYRTTAAGFFKTGLKPVYQLTTTEGFKVRLTGDHRVLKAVGTGRQNATWVEAQHLAPGDHVILHNQREVSGWEGAGTTQQGYLLGLLVGDGVLRQEQAVLSVDERAGTESVRQAVTEAATALNKRATSLGWQRVAGRREYRFGSSALRSLALTFGMGRAITVTPEIEEASSSFYAGFLRGLFDADGSVHVTDQGMSVRLAQPDLELLEAVQRMLARLGILTTLITNRHDIALKDLPDGRGGLMDYRIDAQHELIIAHDSLVRFHDHIGFTDRTKHQRLTQLITPYRRSPRRDSFVGTVEALIPCGVADVYDVQVPGINAFDANGLYVHNCGEQPLPPYGACLLGSVNLTRFVRDAFTDTAHFDWEEYRDVVRIFTRMLDNVVDVNGLPLPQQQQEIMRKRRHGMGYLGLGSTLTLLKMTYGSPESLEFTEEVTRIMAEEGWNVGLELAQEKGPAPIMEEEFTVTPALLAKRPEMAADGIKAGDKVKGRVLLGRYSRYMQQFPEALRERIATEGVRFTHHSSIAPTGTISLSLGNNASNGIEPSFAHHYSRNVIREGKKSKEKVDVFSFELLAYRTLINPNAMPFAESGEGRLPDYFVDSSNIPARAHVDIQAAAQKWIDSSISKTINVPTDYPYEDFKDIYFYAYEKGLKGCTTFRFNPEAFQGVLVTEKDLENTTYRFTLEDGSTVEAKGNETIEYDGELHSAANLYDALKEGYYGKF